VIVKCKCKECNKEKVIIFKNRNDAHKVKKAFKNKPYCSQCQFRKLARNSIRSGF